MKSDWIILCSELKKAVWNHLIFVICAAMILALLSMGFISECISDAREMGGTAAEDFSLVIPFVATPFSIFVAALSSITLAVDYERGYVKLLLSLPVPKRAVLLSKFLVSVVDSMIFYSILVGQYVLMWSASGMKLGETMPTCVLISYAITLAFIVCAISIGFIASVVFRNGLRALSTVITVLVLYFTVTDVFSSYKLMTLRIGEAERYIALIDLSPMHVVSNAIDLINLKITYRPDSPALQIIKPYLLALTTVGTLPNVIIAVVLLICAIILFIKNETP